ncbi:MAG TPA: glycosyltransferase [Anaerolineae bacterium]|nr:glycosyltransferase [Anaerolineae bacterium]
MRVQRGVGMISVIVPAYNAADTINACLNALAAQTIPQDAYEVIVVDDGSTDDTAERARAAGARVRQQANQGPAAARNLGARHARGDLLLFTDADCAPAPDWIERLSAVFADPDVVGAKGAYLTHQQGLVPRFVQAEYEDRYDRMAQAETIDFIDTYSAAYRRDVFLENGGFDPILPTASVEDQEFSFRLAQKGYKLVFVPEARVYHRHDPTLRDYVRRKFYIGYWKALLTQWHPERLVHDSHTPQVLKLQMVLVALLGPTLLATPFWNAGRWATLALAALLSASAIPFVVKTARRDPPIALIAPGMLVVRAVALLSGFVAGQVRWIGPARPAEARRPVIRGWKRAVKRLMDIIGATIGLVLSAPLMLLIAIAIKLDSPGPVLYIQWRVGEGGRGFRIIKFRSMVPDAEERLEELIDLNELPAPAFKLKNDPRVTRVGRLLRRFSLDELPQFWNVLRGEMSLVGPRPEEERIVRLYNDHQRRRLAVKPGMTGPMQVNGRGDLPFERRIELELDYIEHYSLRQDLVILARTLPAVLRGEGSY